MVAIGCSSSWLSGSTAAATATAATAAAEAAALEVADANPLTGWPAVPLRHMQRPSAAGGWVAVPARPRQPSEADGSGAHLCFNYFQLAKLYALYVSCNL